MESSLGDPVLLCAALCSPVLPCVTLCSPVFPCVTLCYPVYLLKSSCHPSHTKKSIPYTMTLRQRRICSTDDFFKKRLNALAALLINTAYKHRFIQQEINKVRLIPPIHALETSTRRESDRVAFVVTFSPALPNINHIISGILNILHSSQRCKEALPSAPLISYRRCNNLRENLVRAKHRRPPPKHLELSAVIEVGVRRVLLLQREPRLTPSSLPTNNDASDTTTPVHLPISFT